MQHKHGKSEMHKMFVGKHTGKRPHHAAESSLRKQVKKFPEFYDTQRFITMFTTAHHLFLS
jgi:hypothetical protein